MARRIAVLAAMALVAAACGSGEVAETTTSLLPPVSTTGAPAATTTTAPSTSTTAAPAEREASASLQLATIRAAIARSTEITSGRMEGLIEVSGAVEDGATMDISMPFGASFDTVTGNSSFFIDLSAIAAAGGEEIPPEFADMFGEMEVRVVDGVSYIRFPFFALLFGAETPWISAPAEEGADLTSDFTFAQPDNPAEILEQLEDADAEVTEVGRETVNGVDTTHYFVVFDTSTVYAEATAEERAELEESGYFPEGELPIDLWISDDGVVVRYVMDIDGALMPSPDGDEFERMLMTFDLLDVNQPVDIVAPDPSEVTDIESLGGFFGIPEG
jgi:hypothetical protein